jgi:competence protein ComEA
VDPSAAPWRALESTTPATPAEAPTTEQRSLPLTAVAAAVGAVGLAVVAFVLAFGSGGRELRIAGGAELGSLSSDAPSSGSVTGTLVVEVVGAVLRPGVYRMAPGARVGDLVEQAGGYSARVDVDGAAQTLNLAAPLQDGVQVRVPSRDDAGATPAASVPGAGSPGDLVDLNVATSAELEELPGIGPATAAKIIAAREEQPFGSVDELRERSILGEKTFEKLRTLVTVR